MIDIIGGPIKIKRQFGHKELQFIDAGHHPGRAPRGAGVLNGVGAVGGLDGEFVLCAAAAGRGHAKLVAVKIPHTLPGGQGGHEVVDQHIGGEHPGKAADRRQIGGVKTVDPQRRCGRRASVLVIEFVVPFKTIGIDFEGQTRVGVDPRRAIEHGGAVAQWQIVGVGEGARPGACQGHKARTRVELRQCTREPTTRSARRMRQGVAQPPARLGNRHPTHAHQGEGAVRRVGIRGVAWARGLRRKIQVSGARARRHHDRQGVRPRHSPQDANTPKTPVPWNLQQHGSRLA